MDKLQFLTIVLLATTALRPCCGQDLGVLQARYLHHLSNLEALQFYKDNTDRLTELKEALAALTDLWTVHAPQLMQDSLSGFPVFTEACRNSTLGLILMEEVVPEAALPIVDAAGKLGAGLLAGNVILNGAFDECFSVNYTGFCRLDGLKIISNNSLAEKLSFTVGLCVPKHCTGQDVALLINYTDLFQLSESNVHCTNTKYASYSAGAIVMIFVCVLFILLVLVGTGVDVAMKDLPKLLEKEEDTSDNPSINNNINNNESSTEATPLIKQSVVKKADSKPRVNPVQFITAFSLFKTVPTLLATKQAPGVITSLNGLRVISMFWVILGHTHFWVFIQTVVRIDNILTLFSIGKRFSFQVVSSGFFSVDSFFFLSAVLVAYLTLRQMKKKGGRFPYINYYVHRYLRLTPTYAFVLFFAWFLTKHLSYGPILTLDDPFAASCKKYWWTNFLYINNLFPYAMMDGCISWSWYLANDMQFYIITPLILIPAYYFLPVGIAIGSAFLASGFIITAALTGVYDYQANTFSLLAYGYDHRNTTKYGFSDMIYVKPWNRIAPYLVGLMLGYLIYKNARLNKIPRLFKLLLYSAMWAVAAFAMFWVVYGLYFTWHGHRPGMFENIIYIDFSRFIWAGCLALIVFACHNGYGWFINSFLSMSMWTPLARMTFNAYLVHPIVMTVVYGQLQISLHYTDITMASFFIVFVVLSYAAAGLLCVVVEFPLSTIEMLIFGMFGSKGRETQRQVNLEPREQQKDVKA